LLPFATCDSQKSLMAGYVATRWMCWWGKSNRQYEAAKIALKNAEAFKTAASAFWYG
jgi:hypothetical protein